MGNNLDLAAACGDYLNAWNADDDDTDRVRAVYDAAARILNDDIADPVIPVVIPANHSTDLWRLRADYIDAHAAWIAGADPKSRNSHDAAAALIAALAGHEVTP
jgi:hypothetical protein